MSSEQSRIVLRNQNRSAVRLGFHLEKHLLGYAAAAATGILATTAPSEAEVVYTPCNTPMAIAQQNQGVAITLLDLDNDGNPDFAFKMLSTAQFSSGGTTTRFKFFLKIVPDQADNGAVQGLEAPTASAVPQGAEIGPKQKFGAAGLYLAINSFNNGSRHSGTWQNVEYAYVGLKFLINGQVHYGWVRVKFPFNGGVGYPSIFGYAYESTPNQPIIAGEASRSAPQSTGAVAPASLGMLAAGESALNFWRVAHE